MLAHRGELADRLSLDRDLLVVEWLPLHVGAVEPERVFREVASVRAERLVGGDRRIVLARGDAEARREAVGDVGLEADARTEAETVAVPVGVEVRRVRQVRDRRVVRRAAVDRAEVHELRVVALRVADALVAGAHVAVEADARGPFRILAGRSPAFLLGLRHDLAADFVAELLLHIFRHVGDALRSGGRGGGLRGACLAGGGLRLSVGVAGGLTGDVSLVLSLLDEA